MFFEWLKRKVSPEPLQNEYLDLLSKIMNSPLWDGSEQQLRSSLPKDLNERTLECAKKQFNNKIK